MKKILFIATASLMMMTAAPLISTASTQSNLETTIQTDAEFKVYFNDKWSAIESQLEAKTQDGKLVASNVKVPMTELVNLMNEGYDFLKSQFIGNEALMNQKMDDLNQRGELRSELYKLSLTDSYTLTSVKEIVGMYKDVL